jgi:hypothetical protein
MSTTPTTPSGQVVNNRLQCCCLKPYVHTCFFSILTLRPTHIVVLTFTRLQQQNICKIFLNEGDKKNIFTAAAATQRSEAIKKLALDESTATDKKGGL